MYRSETAWTLPTWYGPSPYQLLNIPAPPDSFYRPHCINSIFQKKLQQEKTEPRKKKKTETETYYPTDVKREWVDVDDEKNTERAVEGEWEQVRFL